MKTVIVTIERLSDQPIHHGTHVLKKLREKGIPIAGVLWPEYAEYGTLTVTADFVGNVTYEWRDE